MSNSDEQQPQPQPQRQSRGRHGRPGPEQDPYGTQTWQSETWETGYQPVQQVPQSPAAPLGGVPGQQQPVAPEGWFRDEAPAGPGQAPPSSEWAAETAYLPPYQEQAPVQQPQPQPQPQQAQPFAPEGWFREEAPAGPGQAPPSSEWAAETAYLPPVREDAAQQGWYREEAPAAPAPAPGGNWAETTAYLPPQAAAPQTPDAAATAYLPPVRNDDAAATAYLPPVRNDDAGATAYLPPVTDATAPPAPAARGAAATPAAPGEEPEYSPPTLAGNTLRAVDPAQARAEGRSPIIDPGPQSAVLTAALGLLLAGAAALGDLALLVPLIALQGLTAAGWFRLNGMWPARQGIALAFAGAVVADAAVLAVDDAYGPGAIIGTLGAWVLLTLVLQLRSHADPDERMYGLMASVASAALAVVCAGYLASGSQAVSVGAAAVAVAVFARALPLPTPASVAVSLAAAAGAGIAVGSLNGLGAGGALVGLAAGVCALVGLRVAAYDYPSKFVHMTAGVALPLAAAAPAVYLMGRVVG
ncbi:hypothetical protein GCM10010347_58490 [Streptomyces cirratus]|uniref:Integral membrane protein n=1 Tax=Streptomyces cirratus TaxID=68187 RepID=A0ABQ3F331_9ACTN|nr:hypothetical protein [Streptomyces cirratus]GHB80154.1 hypothetical protein GCM10010347_58490 [Streptomyces cirratus]